MATEQMRLPVGIALVRSVASGYTPRVVARPSVLTVAVLAPERGATFTCFRSALHRSIIDVEFMPCLRHGKRVS